MKKILLAFAVVAFIATSCNQTKKVVEANTNTDLTGTYTVTTVKGNTISIPAVLRFNNEVKEISGNSGCNDFSGNYSQDGMAINVGQLMATEAYCDEAVMKNESAILRAIKSTGTFNISEGILTLFSKTDRSVLLIARKEK